MHVLIWFCIGEMRLSWNILIFHQFHALIYTSGWPNNRQNDWNQQYLCCLWTYQKNGKFPLIKAMSYYSLICFFLALYAATFLPKELHDFIVINICVKELSYQYLLSYLPITIFHNRCLSGPYLGKYRRDWN